MINCSRNFVFLRFLFVNVAIFSTLVFGAEDVSGRSENKDTETSQGAKILYQIIDTQKTNFHEFSFQNGFGINSNGNVLFSDGEKMFLDDDSNSVQNFSDYMIPKIYFQDGSLEDIAKLRNKYFFLGNLEITPVVNEIIKDVVGECKNSTCISPFDKIEKKHMIGIGGSGQEEVGLMIVSEVVGLNGALRPIFKYKIFNADTITAIGGLGEYAAGVRSSGVVNANRLIAIGGNQNGADGFLNEYILNVGNLIAIGGGKLGVSGLSNSNGPDYSIIKANSIVAIGGTEAYAHGLYNSGKIRTNFLTTIGGKDVNAVGFYNKKDIQADVVIALATQNSGVAILNEGTIDVETLIILGKDKGYHSLANYGGKINAKNIYLSGNNTIDNRDEGSILTNNLFVNGFSSIQGDIGFDASKDSLLSFNLTRPSSGNVLPYFGIKNGNLILNPNTKIEVKFSNEWVLGNNLSYDTIYDILSITGKGQLIDNRAQKNINFLGLAMIPNVKIDKTKIMIAFVKENSPDPFAPSKPQVNAIKDKVSSLGISSSEEKIIEKLRSISDQAPQILNSIIESNNNGNKFQEVAIDEGLKNFDSNPKLLIDLIQKTDETFKDNAIGVGNSSQKAIQYINQKVTDRINTVMFNRGFETLTFSEIIRKWALASNDDAIYIPKFSPKNSAWVNIGGSYYQNAPTSSNFFSVTSVNSSLGYDGTIDISKDVDFVLGGLFNYSKSFYYQNNKRRDFDIFTLGIYSNTIVNKHEIQLTVSGTELLGDAKIHNEEIGISEEKYTDNNFAFNIEGFYKYKFTLADKHFIKPLALANYSFLYTPSIGSKTFFLKSKKDQILALGVGGEYHFQNSFMKHIVQLTGRYHIKDIAKSRSVSFKGAQTFINYDLNPSRIWMKLSYGTKFSLPRSFDLDISVSTDVSTSGDFLGMGNLGMSYIW
ncbi:hypothetical protein BKH42_02130 [Helicobacter sp. 13S00482-2]|uniref:autotransporter outer membrane beta-barrel domain-containing protein n=1 Tax=Helicobacter sp. 13S00482-2 TaxID=1476200 RepID=UPI000BA652A6|nr:autotransporter outer membrane beta-barrel domain-containing protein [Helicobacter sp. 13S00482-2]PAF54322.1 hypothetical protein BKH42_02130 [Helicobacter sp. 13S00482-2]